MIIVFLLLKLLLKSVKNVYFLRKLLAALRVPRYASHSMPSVFLKPPDLILNSRHTGSPQSN